MYLQKPKLKNTQRCSLWHLDLLSGSKECTRFISCWCQRSENSTKSPPLMGGSLCDRGILALYGSWNVFVANGLSKSPSINGGGLTATGLRGSCFFEEEIGRAA